jgi:transcriptional antiterminator RfaH
MPEPYWAVARTEVNREGVAASFLGKSGYRTYLPRLRETRSNHGRRQVVTPCLFPCYAFVRIEAGWWDARWCIGVVNLIMGVGDEPAKVGDHIIAELKSRERNGYVELDERPGLRPGDQVKLTSGPFTGHLGLFVGMRGPERVAVLLALFGSQRPAILPAAAVERA